MPEATFWVRMLCDGDHRTQVIEAAETAGLREFFTSRTLEEAIRAYEIVEARYKEAQLSGN
jgi:hypothetical protein